MKGHIAKHTKLNNLIRARQASREKECARQKEDDDWWNDDDDEAGAATSQSRLEKLRYLRNAHDVLTRAHWKLEQKVDAQASRFHAITGALAFSTALLAIAMAYIITK